MNNRRPPSIFNAGAARFAPVGQSVTRPKAQRPKGPKAQRPKGPKAQRPKGPKAQRPKGPKAQRPKGPKAQRPKGQRPKGPKAQRPKGPKAQRPKGPKAQGPKAQRPKGPKAQRPKGPKAQRPKGPKAQRPKGPKAQRPKGPKAQRPKGPKAQRPKGPKAQRPEGPKARRPEGPKAQRPEGPKAQRPKGPKAQRPKGPKAQRPKGPKAPRPKALRLQVPAGSQCLRPHGDARPPHEQGAGALRFGSDGAAVGADGGRPTSRGLPPAVRWATLPCPGGQGTLPVCVFDAVCPAGKGASELARRIMACRGKEQGLGTFCPSGCSVGAPGNGAAARFPARETEIHAIPQTRRILILPPLPRPPRAASAVLYKAHLPAIAFRGEHPARECVQGPPFTLPVAASSPSHPAGRTAGSARTRSRVQTLENPFLGTPPFSPIYPVPNAAGGKSLLVDLPPCTRSAAGQKRNEASPPPAHGADLRDPRAKGTGRRPCRLTMEPTAPAGGPAAARRRANLRWGAER